MRNRTYGGVRGRKTKVGRKLSFSSYSIKYYVASDARLSGLVLSIMPKAHIPRESLFEIFEFDGHIYSLTFINPTHLCHIAVSIKLVANVVVDRVAFVVHTYYNNRI